MPPRRNRRNRRAPKSKGYLDTASRALAVAYAVKKLINVEFKSLSTSFTVDPNSSGAVLNLTAIAQNDTFSGRDGNKVRAKYISSSGTLQLHGSATDSRVRIMIVRDNNGSTSQPAITDLFPSVTNFVNNKTKTGDPQSNSRFSILSDKIVYLNTDTPSRPYKWSMSLDHHIYFTGSASTDEGKGHIYQFIGSNEATNDPIVAIDAMVKFLDN